MSCSVFKEFPESNDSHLVVVINKNGNVSVDQSELHDFLVNNDSNKSNTTVSVVRLASPTPSIEEELNEQEELEKEMAKALYATEDESGDNTDKEEVIKIPNVSVVVEKYYNADEAKQFASEILSAAGITDPKQVVKDLAHQRRAVVNDHCYTPLTSPSQRKSESRRSTPVQVTKKPDVKSKPTPPAAQPKKAEASEEEEEVSDEEGDESDSENYCSPSESDRDSDLDFNVSGRPTRVRKLNRSKNSKIKRVKGTGKVTKKRASVADDDKSDEATTSSGKKKPVKRRSLSTNKTTSTPSASSAKPTTPLSKSTASARSDADAELKKDSPASTSASTIVTPGPPVPALTPITNPKTLPQKKDKKQPAHSDAYLNNMSSLFSTPDIIKKVDNETRASPTTTSTPTNKTYFMPLNPSSIKNPQQLPAQISVQTHTATPDLEFEQDKQLDLIDLFVRDIVQEELKQNTAPHIPNIVKMLDNTDGAKMGDVNNSTQSTSNTSTIVSASTIRGTLMDTSDILGIGNVDDFLPDDVLQDVAKLVEDKKIQEVIDKQVLEVKATTTPVLPPLNTNVTKPDSTLKGPARIDAPKPEKKADSSKSNLSQSAITTPVQAKEPIKIVRSDGRVILLPPLEAPTTRAKRRALTQSFDAVAKEESSTSTPKAKPAPKVVEEVKEKEKARRSSTTKKAAEPPKPKAIVPESTTVDQPPDDDDYDDEDSDGSHNAEDDPYRLWCICRQPHNNRFMICCDKCEDWFHGKCVNVTKAMGTEMEEQGIEWVCPNCIKKQPGKKPPERKSSTNKNASLNSSQLLCIVCKNQARPNSIYCSDDCIRKHAQTTATNVTSSSQNDSSSKLDASKKSTPAKSNSKAEYTITKNNRVIVFEEKSGRVLTGNTAPTPDTLKQWLLDNPTFEVVKPGSKQAQFIKVKQKQINRERQEQNSSAQGDKQRKSNQQQQQQQQQPQKIQTTLKIGSSNNVMIVNPKQKSSATATTPTTVPAKVATKKPGQQPSPKPISPVKQSPVQSKTAPKPTTPKTPAPRTNQNKRKSDPKSDSKSTDNRNETSSETIRVTVHRLLNEAISHRMSEVTDTKHPKLTAEEIDSFASDTEREIYNLFSKDIGAKYRAKYRSLVFNIKDRKNDSLFLKICEKTIKPNQFVRMSAEELASQQLAQWRENENKHQLEMIKKSELDLLAASKTYVLKTHKGEEVIESKVTDRLTLDPSIFVEDVVSVLNNSTVSSTSETVGQISPTKDTRFDKYLSVDSSIISGSSKLGSSSSSKKKDGHRSRSRSRDRTQDKHDRKSGSSKHKRKRSRDRRSGEKDDKSRDRDRDSKKKDDKDRRDRDKPKSTDSKTDHKKSSDKAKEPPKPVKGDNFSLIDKILEAQSTIDRVLRAEDTKKTESKIAASESVEPQGDAQLEQKLPKLPPTSECDQEPTSTVTIPTPPEYLFDKQLSDVESALWTGMITMVDLATFQISVFGVSGNCESIRKELPNELDIVGRIFPDTVWEYIDKIKKNKEILIVRLSAATEEDNDAYCELYKHLYTRKRLGVIKTTSRVLKDFYIFPLAAHKSIPSVLQPIDGPEFESGRPDLLLGIIVKTTLAVTAKRPTPALITPTPSKVPRLSESLIMKQPKTADERYTPPSSPKTLPKSHVEIPIAMEDGDEPYSPGGSDDEIPFQNTKVIPATAQTSSLYAQLEQDEIQRKMDELNRQIEAQKMEIAMLDSEVVNVDEPYSPSSSLPANAAPSKIPALANISIPSNLQEILNSIKQVSTLPSTDSIVPKSAATTTPSIAANDDDEYNPIPTDAEYNPSDYVPMKTLHSTHFQSTSIDTMQSTSKEPSKLAQLTDEELLSMVPDDIDLPPVSSLKKQTNESVTRMSNYAMFEPPPPGEEEYIPMG